MSRSARRLFLACMFVVVCVGAARAVPAPERPLNLSMPRDVTPREGFGAAAAERFAPEGVRAAVGDAAEPRGGMPFGSGYEARRSRGEGFGGAPGGHPGGMGQGRR